MPLNVDEMTQTMIDNMPEKTGKVLEEWFKLIQDAGLEKHGKIMTMLKGEHGVTHGYANTIAALYRQQAEGGPASEDERVASQYAKNPQMKPWYEKLLTEVNKFGKDVEIAPKKAYVSLRRSKQFAIIQPSTKTRMDLGLNLKDVKASGVLVEGDKWSGMCSHRIEIYSPDNISAEVIGWLQKAYDQAG